MFIRNAQLSSIPMIPILIKLMSCYELWIISIPFQSSLRCTSFCCCCAVVLALQQQKYRISFGFAKWNLSIHTTNGGVGRTAAAKVSIKEAMNEPQRSCRLVMINLLPVECWKVGNLFSIPPHYFLIFINTHNSGVSLHLNKINCLSAIKLVIFRCAIEISIFSLIPSIRKISLYRE